MTPATQHRETPELVAARMMATIDRAAQALQAVTDDFRDNNSPTELDWKAVTELSQAYDAARNVLERLNIEVGR